MNTISLLVKIFGCIIPYFQESLEKLTNLTDLLVTGFEVHYIICLNGELATQKTCLLLKHLYKFRFIMYIQQHEGFIFVIYTYSVDIEHMMH